MAERRRDILLRLQQKIARRWGRCQVGKKVEVLVEGVSEDGLVLARGTAQVGEIVPVRITAASTYDLWGEIVR